MTTLDKKKHIKARIHRALFCRPSESRGIGIQWRLLGYLSLFIAFALIVLWVFQVHMLVPFYENIKRREMGQTADGLALALENEGATLPSSVFDDAVWEYAETYNTCIQVWRVEGDRARIVASADISDGCIIHHISGDRIARLYRLAKEEGGTYSGKVKFHRGGMIWMDNDGTVRESTQIPDEEVKNPVIAHKNDDVSAVLARIKTGADGMEYVIMLDSELEPLNAMVSTLYAQFSWIALILLVSALILAWMMSRRISRPLVRMNESARILAEGNYDVRFSGQGYRETRELAQTLNFAADELSKTDRLQKELIANISHDLRTPLTLITGYGEVMRDLPGENTPENVQVIIDEAEHLSGLVNDLLDLSRLQSGVRAPEAERFDLTATVRKTMERYDKLIRHEGYSIRFTADRSVEVIADRTLILQAVYNLINNAVNYCGADRVVEVEQRVIDGAVRILVRDHGAGIEAEQLPYIWDRYYKVDRVHRRAMIGTGLGLSIVKGALEAHGAQYGVNSTPGEGSEFWFELPLAPEEDLGEE
ncbi:MAG: HAMP domain-containing histidine kinase [Ruminococcaceae bacterium]|nr:HAMP domain-containing histidine kinase [Oscillospiraceae bacterium]